MLGVAVGGGRDRQGVGKVGLLVVIRDSIVMLSLAVRAVNQAEDLTHEGGAQVQGEGGERAGEGEGVEVAARA